MCDSRQPRVARPRWRVLYAIPVVTAAALVAAGRAAPTPSLGTLLTGALIGVAFGAMTWWVRANRAALDRADWCACASNAVGMRVIGSTESKEAIPSIHRPRRHRQARTAPAHRPRVTTTEPSATL